MPAATFQSIADRFVLSNGWKRALAAFLAGAVGALAMPPVSLFPFLIVTMTLAVWLVDGAVAEFHEGDSYPDSRRSQHLANAWVAAKIGWWIGFGYHVAGLWWLGAAFLVEADQFAWALPLGVIGLPAGLAIFTAIGFFLARLFWTTGPSRILVLAVALAVSEWLRGNILTGFPWNDFGMAFGANLLLAQSASLIGLNGLNLLAVAICAAPAVLADRSARKLSVLTAGLALVSLCALFGFGALRLAVPPVPSQPNVRLRIMQPNLAQDDKFRGEYKDAILKHYLDLSDRATSPQTSGIGDVTHLIWPESAFPFILSRDVDALKLIGAFLPPTTTLITGAARMEQGPQVRGQRPRNRYYNAIQVIQSGGMILDSYDKVHLVPFGEYLPLGRWVEAIGLRQFVHIPGGFESGPRRAVLHAPGLPAIAPLVCYEAIFSGEVMPADSSGPRPELMLNVTNDAWFGITPGPYQHFAQARLRAIEEGLPLIRAANTGISAIVDPYGRILSQLPLGIEGVLDGELPKPIAAPVFARHPLPAPLGLALFMLLCAAILRFFETRRSR